MIEEPSVGVLTALAPDKALPLMERLAVNRDPEAAHWDGDMLLLRVLLHYGHEELVLKFCALPKWYA